MDTIDGGTWSVRADVDACPELELVLPARREAVQTPFLDEMRKAARIAIYRAMRRADRTPALSHARFTAARNVGIDMPIAPAVLRPWRPAIADIDDWRDTPNREPVRPDTPWSWRSIPRPRTSSASGGQRNGRGIAGRLFEADTRLEGYAWYERAGAGERRAHRRHRGGRHPIARCPARHGRVFFAGYRHRAGPAGHAGAPRGHPHSP